MSADSPHIPVLLEEVLHIVEASRGGMVVDGTFGAGGYTEALLEASETTQVLALDRDPQAIADGQAMVRRFQGRLTLVEGRFGDLANTIRSHDLDGKIDAIVLDIGVSSMQLDQAQRGFSFRFEAPLDMRMEGKGTKAADLVNEADEAELADIFYYYGEERRARALARAIIAARAQAPITTTKALADLAASVIKGPPGAIHPATRAFQALRIAVNNELEELGLALEGAEKVLKPGGILAIVTFHSLEDRIVKRFFNERSGRSEGTSRHIPHLQGVEPSFVPITRRAIEPSAQEIARNPRARSAKLRAARRLATPGRPCPESVMALARLPSGRRT